MIVIGWVFFLQITTPSQIRKTWNAKYTLRSHFDGIRALSFHPTEPVLITASEDQTLKMWNLQKTIPAKKSASLDVEPVYTFRAHTGPVLSLALSPEGDYAFSGGIDSTVRVWNMPNPNVDPYDNYCKYCISGTSVGGKLEEGITVTHTYTYAASSLFLLRIFFVCF